MSSEPVVRVFPTDEELFRSAAEKFCEIGQEAIRDRGCYTVALSGGSTPKGLHHELATTFASKLPWDKVFFFWGDERHVPPDFPESNFRMAKETLLLKLPIPQGNIFRMPGENPDAHQGAAAYEQTLREFFGGDSGKLPRIDFNLLGMGPDGHTASLFPGTKGLAVNDCWVYGNWVEQHSTFRITMTYPVLNNSANVMFLITGEGKAEMVRKALKEPSAKLPCQGVKPTNGRLMWYLDADAGSKL